MVHSNISIYLLCLTFTLSFRRVDQNVESDLMDRPENEVCTKKSSVEFLTVTFKDAQCKDLQQCENIKVNVSMDTQASGMSNVLTIQKPFTFEFEKNTHKNLRMFFYIAYSGDGDSNSNIQSNCELGFTNKSLWNEYNISLNARSLTIHIKRECCQSHFGDQCKLCVIPAKKSTSHKCNEQGNIVCAFENCENTNQTAFEKGDKSQKESHKDKDGAASTIIVAVVLVAIVVGVAAMVAAVAIKKHRKKEPEDETDTIFRDRDDTVKKSKFSEWAPRTRMFSEYAKNPRRFSEFLKQFSPLKEQPQEKDHVGVFSEFEDKVEGEEEEGEGAGKGEGKGEGEGKGKGEVKGPVELDVGDFIDVVE